MLDFYPWLGPKVVVPRMGEAGAYLATAVRRVRIAAYPVVAVDATGAGDAFCGSFLARSLAGDGPETAARYARSRLRWRAQGMARWDRSRPRR